MRLTSLLLSCVILLTSCTSGPFPAGIEFAAEHACYSHGGLLHYSLTLYSLTAHSLVADEWEVSATCRNGMRVEFLFKA